MQLWELRRETCPWRMRSSYLPGGIKKRLLYEKAPSQIPTLYPFIHHFWQTRYPFRIPSTVKPVLNGHPLEMPHWLLITGWLFNTNLWYKQTRRAELKESQDRLIRKDTGLTNVIVIQENEASQKAEYLSHDKLTLICFYLFLGQKKKVKNNLTPYTVWPVALVWYVFYSSQSEVKTIKNNSLAPRKRWPLPLRPA